jgi:hypothetical protein
MINNTTDTKEWFRQPLVWMVIFFPLSAVIGGIITIYLAVESDDGLVEDDYYEQGKTINRTLDRDNKALEFGLTATMQVKNDALELNFVQQRDLQLPDPLVVKLMSATRPGMDKQILIPAMGNGMYKTPLNPIEAGKWYVETGTADWRITGTLVMPTENKITLSVQQ